MKFDNSFFLFAIGAFVAFRAYTLGDWVLSTAGTATVLAACATIVRRPPA
jgi:hypothetical protein